MDGSGPIHGKSLQDALFHPVDEDRVESHLNGMGAHAQQDHLLSEDGFGNPSDDLLKFLSGQDCGQGVKKVKKGSSFLPGLRKRGLVHLMFFPLQGCPMDLVEVEGGFLFDHDISLKGSL